MIKDLKIVNIEIDGIDYNDSPDFVDAFIASANYEDGTELTEEDLEVLNEDRSFVYECVINRIY